ATQGGAGHPPRIGLAPRRARAERRAGIQARDVDAGRHPLERAESAQPEPLVVRAPPRLAQHLVRFLRAAEGGAVAARIGMVALRDLEPPLTDHLAGRAPRHAADVIEVRPAALLER